MEGIEEWSKGYDTYPFCLQNYIKTLKVIYRINRFLFQHNSFRIANKIHTKAQY